MLACVKVKGGRGPGPLHPGFRLRETRRRAMSHSPPAVIDGMHHHGCTPTHQSATASVHDSSDPPWRYTAKRDRKDPTAGATSPAWSGRLKCSISPQLVRSRPSVTCRRERHGQVDHAAVSPFHLIIPFEAPCPAISAFSLTHL